MLTGLCLSLILLHHRVKSGYPVRKKKKCVDSPDGLGCPRLLPVGDHPQQRLQRNAVTDCSLHIVSEMEHTAKQLNVSFHGTVMILWITSALPDVSCCLQWPDAAVALPVSYTINNINT